MKLTFEKFYNANLEQAAAAAHMMMDSGDQNDALTDAASSGGEKRMCGDALARLEGAPCGLCGESMATSGVVWSRLEVCVDVFMCIYIYMCVYMKTFMCRYICIYAYIFE